MSSEKHCDILTAKGNNCRDFSSLPPTPEKWTYNEQGLVVLEQRKCVANSILSISIFSYFNKITSEPGNKVKVCWWEIVDYKWSFRLWNVSFFMECKGFLKAEVKLLRRLAALSSLDYFTHYNVSLFQDVNLVQFCCSKTLLLQKGTRLKVSSIKDHNQPLEESERECGPSTLKKRSRKHLTR